MKLLYVAVSVLVLTILSFLLFPGYTYLQSDTQIYIPILERFWDPSVFEHDIVATRPHVAFTIYDEVTIGLRRITGLEFQHALVIQQFAFRALGIVGVYLIATAAALPVPMALFAGAAYTLGATILGPSVLTVEYEAVPRGFTVPMVLLATGLCANGRVMAGAVAGAFGSMYHPPTLYPFAIVFLLFSAWRRELRALVVFLTGPALLLLSSRVQMGLLEPQDFFGVVDAELEQLQRMRASYNWVSVWIGRYFWHYAVLVAGGLLAYWRVRQHVRPELKPFILGLPLVGVLSVPLSYIFMDLVKWSLMPQLQPARALLFVVVMAVILFVAAGVHAGLKRRWIESALWFLPVFAVPSQPFFFQVLWRDLSNPVIRTRALVVLSLALLAALAMWIHSRWPRWSPAALAVATVLPFFALPHLAQSRNYPPLHHSELDALASWARTSTPKDAVFLFPDSDRNLVPGVFRARSLRSLYVDWKGGGQVNFLKNFAGDWWERWQRVMGNEFDPSAISRFRETGIDYVVLTPKNRLADQQAVYENSGYLVYTTNGDE